MAKNIKEVRETMGVYSKPIDFDTYETIKIELGKYKLAPKATNILRRIEYDQFKDAKVITVRAGGNPNLNKDKMDKEDYTKE